MTDNTLWLHNVVVQMLNTESSPLWEAFHELEDRFHLHSAKIYLRERYVESHTILIYIEDGIARKVDAPENELQQMNSVISRVLEARKLVTIDHGLALPLRGAKTSEFGVLFLETEHTELDFRMQEAIDTFSKVLYANAMGGFLKTPHNKVLEVKNVTAKYDLKNPAAPNIVTNCSFDINAGEVTVLMGYSGCGKSTLLNVIGGLLTPVSGEVLWNGTDICRMNRREMDRYHRDTLGFIFQNYNLISDLTARENVSVAASLSPNSQDPVEVLKTLGLGHRIDSRPKQMSGGEQQRVCIARALVKNPKILLCDEPTGALDTENTRNIMYLLQKIAREQNIPVVIVTHNPDFVILADHFIFMKDGEIEKDYYQPFPVDEVQ